ncbi:maker108, partial [Drosophila busckii]
MVYIISALATPYYDDDKIDNLGKYVVSIRSRTPHRYYGDNHYCGGAIISRLFILTAAQCVMDHRYVVYRARFLFVVAGTPNRLKFVRDESVGMPAKRVFVPESFTLLNMNNIALILLLAPLPEDNQRVGIIQLPKRPAIAGEIYQVIGWGRVFLGGFLSSKALIIDIDLQNDTVCKDLLQDFQPGMLCAGNLESTEDEHPCAGDSGNPFMRNLTVYGIVTYQLGCGQEHVPSIYTDVYFHLDWVNDIMTKNSSGEFNICLLYALLMQIT